MGVCLPRRWQSAAGLGLRSVRSFAQVGVLVSTRVGCIVGVTWTTWIPVHTANVTSCADAEPVQAVVRCKHHRCKAVIISRRHRARSARTHHAGATDGWPVDVTATAPFARIEYSWCPLDRRGEYVIEHAEWCGTRTRAHRSSSSQNAQTVWLPRRGRTRQRSVGSCSE